MKKTVLLLSICIMSVVVKAQTNKGKVSYYGNKFHGRQTATGEIFDKNKNTAASNIFPLGTIVQFWRVITNDTGQQDTLKVKVKINDRMAPSYGKRRVADLSEGAMKQLKGRKEGVIEVHYDVL